MRWIRSPGWDGFWLLSGLPIGLWLMLIAPRCSGLPLGMNAPPCSQQMLFWVVFGIAITVFEFAHLTSPVIVAWTHPELRGMVRQAWIKHLLAPPAVIASVLLLPPRWVFNVYWTWNIYHFGMQNFGVSSLYWRDYRQLRKWGCLGVTAFGMAVLPLITQSVAATMLSTGIFSFNHWLTDIGLSSRVVRWHWAFIVLVLAIGSAWFLLRQGPLSARVVPHIIVIGYGLGIIHFIYSGGGMWRSARRLLGK